MKGTHYALEPLPAMEASSEGTEFLFAQAGLFEDFSKCSERKSSGMHREVSLTPIGMAKDLVTAALADLEKAGPL
jgi:hypothetical protein